MMPVPHAAPAKDAEAELRREIANQATAVEATLGDPALGSYVDRLAEAVAASGELLVTGMGASLHAGLVLASLLRGRGVRAWALPTSELLHYGGAMVVRPMLVLSQSGASVEVERLVAAPEGGLYGLTLDPDSPLGRVGAGVLPGGPERAYAATRSFTTTLTALLALAQRLGVPVRLQQLSPSLQAVPDEPEGLAAAVAGLAGAATLFVTGRGQLFGLAEYVALLVMELARLPCASLEAAQFRHGPREAAGEPLAVVALAAEGGTGDLVRRFAGEVASYGSPTVVLDAGGRPPARDGVVTLRVPRADEVAALLPLALAAQRLAVGLAEGRGVTPGLPVRSGKVTREE